MVNNLPAVGKTWVLTLVWKDPLEEIMATDSSILAWRIPWTEKPGRLQIMGSQGAGYNSVTKHSAAHTVQYGGSFKKKKRNYLIHCSNLEK